MSDTLVHLVGEVETAAQRVAALPDDARAAAEALRHAADEVHAEALRDIVRLLQAQPDGAALLGELARMPAVRTVLLAHGIMQPGPAAKAAELLDRLRPALLQHGGDAEVADYQDGRLSLRLTGACAGNSMTALSLQEEIATAIGEAVDGITAIETAPEPRAPVALGTPGRRPVVTGV